ncbi:MAG: hypothetical protein J7497_14805 [Chitinophagaceae bacterium]|nr:hypothetical protein [Chitinophagaceae bacterium]
MPIILFTTLFLSIFGSNCINDQRIAFLPYNVNAMWINIKGHDTTISFVDAQRTKKIICEAVKDYNAKHKQKDFRIHQLNKYYLQCVPYVDSTGHLKIWVQGVQGTPKGDRWKKEIDMIMDGGNSVFTLEVDLTDNKGSNVGINGWG